VAYIPETISMLSSREVVHSLEALPKYRNMVAEYGSANFKSKK